MGLENNGAVEIDIKEVFFLLLHRIWIILLAGSIGAGCAFAVSRLVMKPVYTSTTSVYVINRQEEDKTTISDIQTGTQLTKDYMILVKSRPVTQQVISKLNLNLTDEQLAKMIKVNTPQDTRILEISIECKDAELAKKIADAVAEVSAEKMVSIMEMDKVNIVEQGNLPTEPSGPNTARNTLLGGFLGIFISSILISMIYLLNDTIRTAEDIEKYLEITTLGTIPISEEKNTKKRRMKEKKRKAVLAG